MIKVFTNFIKEAIKTSRYRRDLTILNEMIGKAYLGK